MTPEDLHTELALERRHGVTAIDACELDRWEVARPMTPEDLHRSDRPTTSSPRDQDLRRVLERHRATARVEQALDELAELDAGGDRYLRCTTCGWAYPIETTAAGERCTECTGHLEVAIEPAAGEAARAFGCAGPIPDELVPTELASPAHSREQFGLSSVGPSTTPQED